MHDVHQVLQRIDDAWRSGRLEPLSESFHPAMVIVGLGYQELVRGREATLSVRPRL